MESYGVRFGRLVRIRRGVEGLTQEALAERAFGIVERKSRISELENGKIHRPQQRTVDAISVALGITPEELKVCFSNEITINDYNLKKRTSETCLSSSDVDDNNKRILLKALIGAFLPSSPQRLRNASDINPNVVSDLISIRNAMVGTDAMFGARSLVNGVEHQIAFIKHLLKHAPPSLCVKLFEVGAMFSEFAGWLSDDGGQLEDGRRWSNQALDWAHASENKQIVSYILMRKAQQACLIGNGPLATGLASSANQFDKTSNKVSAAAAIQQARMGVAR